MSRCGIAVYKAEIDGGVADIVRAQASVAYLVEVSPMDIPLLDDELRAAFAARSEGGRGESDTFGLYHMKDVLVTTGWNKNRDVFDRVETWNARHTPEDRPFNFEHRPLDIIGHITASHVVDDRMQEIADDIPMDDLPNKFHVVNGSVLYMDLADDERKALMRQTVDEIERGEWYVSMECHFRGFDYGVIGPDGSHRILPRNEATAFLTKHLSQYKGTGTYISPDTGDEYTLGRVFRNITFKGKGLVRKPGNPESIILNSVACFVPTLTDSGYLISRPEATSQIHQYKTSITEPTHMADQVTNSDQAERLERELASARAEIATLKNKDTEAAIAALQKDMASRDATIADRDKAVASLQAQIQTVTETVASITKRAEAAEASLATASEALTKVRAAETRRAREQTLRDKHAPATVVAGLVEKLAVLDDQAFADTVETISASWKKPEQTPSKVKVDPVVDAVARAKPEEDSALATETQDEKQTAYAAVVNFMGKSMSGARGGRPSIFADTNADA